MCESCLYQPQKLVRKSYLFSENLNVAIIIMKKLLVFIFCASALSTMAQNHKVILHPVLGEIIDQEEKGTYLLFSEIPTNEFIEGYLMKESNKFYLHSKTTKGMKKHLMQLETLEEYHNHVEKLLTYQVYVNQSDTNREKPVVVLHQKDTCSLEMDLEYLSPKMKSKLRKDANRYQVLEDEAEKLGYWGDKKEHYINTSGYFVIYSSKKKRK